MKWFLLAGHLAPRGDVTGEIVFTTGMTGYLETLTDPSYQGQIILQTFPLIGNYGVPYDDRESDSVSARAYIVKHLCEHPSGGRSAGDLDAFLARQGIVGLKDIDTRALTRIIREQGVMNGRITRQNPEHVDYQAICSYRVQNAVEQVTPRDRALFSSAGSRYTVALIDFGAKQNIRRELQALDCDVWVLPAHTSSQDILKLAPDGIVLSNGPGDPADNPEIVRQIEKLFQARIPLFGICLGHQLIALANGFATSKLKYGHRGANQPVRDCQSNRVYVTSQNHGYTVLSDSIDPEIAEEWFVHVNDQTCEGIRYKGSPAISVQFHPEGCGGPRDTRFLFRQFIRLMEEKKNAAQ